MLLAFNMLNKVFFIFLLLFSGVDMSVNAQRLIEIDKASFGSRSGDFCPVYFEDGIVFCSKRGPASSLTDIYHSPMVDGEYQDPKIMDAQLMSSYHDGPVTFSPDYNTIYFSRNYKVSKESNGRLQTLLVGIFISHRTDDGWSPPVAFVLNDPNYTIWHPSMSADGNRLYFSSDMEGGHGKFDIWYVDRVDSGWSAPVNPGPEINSARSEVFPYIHSSGRLYFSSNGGKGVGGMDIYRSSPVDGKWSNPVLVPEPINSDADDFGIILSDDMTSGFFSSSRKREDMIFSFKVNFPETTEECDTIKPMNLCASFFEAGPEQDESSPHFAFRWKFGDGTTGSGQSAHHCYEKPGTYHVTLSAIDSINKNHQEIVAEYDYEIAEIQGLYIDCGEKCKPGMEVEFSAERSKLSGERVTEYFWLLGDGTKELGESVSHIYESPGNYMITIIAAQISDNKSNYKSSCAVRLVEVK